MPSSTARSAPQSPSAKDVERTKQNRALPYPKHCAAAFSTFKQKLKQYILRKTGHKSNIQKPIESSQRIPSITITPLPTTRSRGATQISLTTALLEGPQEQVTEGSKIRLGNGLVMIKVQGHFEVVDESVRSVSSGSERVVEGYLCVPKRETSRRFE